MSKRPKTDETIVVQVNNDLLVWTEGRISGTNPELIAAAKWVSEHRLNVDLTPYGPTIVAGLDDKERPDEAVAAMMGAVPGRGIILRAPEEVIDLLPFDEMDSDFLEEDEND